jgi:hypothetical protein
MADPIIHSRSQMHDHKHGDTISSFQPKTFLLPKSKFDKRKTDNFYHRNYWRQFSNFRISYVSNPHWIWIQTRLTAEPPADRIPKEMYKISCVIWHWFENRCICVLRFFLNIYTTAKYRWRWPSPARFDYSGCVAHNAASLSDSSHKFGLTGEWQEVMARPGECLIVVRLLFNSVGWLASWPSWRCERKDRGKYIAGDI